MKTQSVNPSSERRGAVGRSLRRQVRQPRPKRDEWSRGYYCAVAILLKMNYAEGVSGPDADEMFRSGGDWTSADPEDIDTFRRHGLLPNGSDQPPARG